MRTWIVLYFRFKFEIKTGVQILARNAYIKHRWLLWLSLLPILIFSLLLLSVLNLVDSVLLLTTILSGFIVINFLGRLRRVSQPAPTTLLLLYVRPTYRRLYFNRLLTVWSESDRVFVLIFLLGRLQTDFIGSLRSRIFCVKTLFTRENNLSSNFLPFSTYIW